MKASLRLLSVALLMGSSVFAQASNSSQANAPKMILTGTIYDINGAVIPRGHVTAASVDGNKFEAITNNEGTYKFEISLGVYRITSSAPGFCSSTVERFIVINSTFGKMSLDLVLEVPDNQPGCRHEMTIKKPRKSHRRPRTIAEERLVRNNGGTSR